MSFPTPTTSSVDFSKVYEPAEDSFLFLDMLEKDAPHIHSIFKNEDIKSSHSTTTQTLPAIVLEIGTGSGIVSSFVQQNILPKSEGLYLTTDLNIHACRASLDTSKENGGCNYMDTLRVSLADSIRPHLIDLLLFNPPYVPDEIVPQIPKTDDDYEWLDLALLGGVDGMEITWKLLNDLDTILSPKGMAYIIFCKRNKPEQVAQIMSNRGWLANQIGERKAGWEILSLWRFSKKFQE